MTRAALLFCLFQLACHKRLVAEEARRAEVAPAMRQELARRVQAALPTLQ